MECQSERLNCSPNKLIPNSLSESTFSAISREISHSIASSSSNSSTTLTSKLSSEIPNESAQKLAIQFAKHFGSPTSIWPNLNGPTTSIGNPMGASANGPSSQSQQLEHHGVYCHPTDSTNDTDSRLRSGEGKPPVSPSSGSQLEELLQSHQLPSHLLSMNADVVRRILSTVNASIKGGIVNMSNTPSDASAELISQAQREEKSFNSQYPSLFTAGLSTSSAGFGGLPLVYTEDGSHSGLSSLPSLSSIPSLPSLVVATALPGLTSTQIKLSQSNHKTTMQSLISTASLGGSINPLVGDDFTNLDSHSSSSRRASEAVLERLSASISAHLQKSPFPTSTLSSFENEPIRNEDEDNSITADGTANGKKQLCRVCGDTASGRHYGIHSCEGCKGFFKRAIRQKLNYKCRGNGDCKMDRFLRNRCQHCRLKKCYNVGMKSSSVQNERRPHRMSFTSEGELSNPQYSNGDSEPYLDLSGVNGTIITASRPFQLSNIPMRDPSKSSPSLATVQSTHLYQTYDRETVGQLLQEVKSVGSYGQRNSQNNVSSFSKEQRGGIEECSIGNDIEIDDSVSDYQQTQQSMSLKGDCGGESDGEDSIMSEEKTIEGSITSGVSLGGPTAHHFRSQSQDHPPSYYTEVLRRKSSQFQSSDGSLISYPHHVTQCHSMKSETLPSQDEVFRTEDDDHVSTSSDHNNNGSSQTSDQIIRPDLTTIPPQARPCNVAVPQVTVNDSKDSTRREEFSIPEVQHTIYQGFVHAMTFMKMLQIRDHTDKWIHFFLISLCQLLPGDNMHQFLQRLKQHVDVIGGIQNYPSCRAFKTELEKLDMACRGIACIHFSHSDYCVLCKILLQDCYITSSGSPTSDCVQEDFKATDELTHSLIQQHGLHGIQYVTRSLLFLSHLKDINPEIMEELFFSGRTLPPLPLSTLIPFILSASVNVSSLSLPKEVVTAVSLSNGPFSNGILPETCKSTNMRPDKTHSTVINIPLSNSIMASYPPVTRLISSVSPTLCISTTSSTETTQPSTMSFLPLNITSPSPIHEPNSSSFLHNSDKKLNHFLSTEDSIVNAAVLRISLGNRSNSSTTNETSSDCLNSSPNHVVTTMAMDISQCNSTGLSNSTNSSTMGATTAFMKLSSQSSEDSTRFTSSNSSTGIQNE